MLRRSALLAAGLCLWWTGSCIGPGLEPPGGDDDGADLGQNPVTPPVPGMGVTPTPGNPTGMQQPMVPGAGAAGTASEPTKPPTDGAARDAGVSQEDDAGSDDSGVKR